MTNPERTDDPDLGHRVARAVSARRPPASRDLDLRLRAAASRPVRRSWLVPAVLGALVIAAGALVIVARGGRSAPHDVAQPSAPADRPDPRPDTAADPPPAPAGGDLGADLGPAPPAGADLDPYHALLERLAADPGAAGVPLTDAQLQQLRTLADDLARDKAMLVGPLQVAELDLRRAIERDDPAAAARQLDQVIVAEGRLRHAVLTAQLAARAVLDPDQRDLLSGRGPAPGPHRVAPRRPPPAPVARAPKAPRADRPTAELTIRTDPPGARVLIDGRVVGTSPLRAQVSLGVHQVETQLAGYADHLHTVDVSAGEPVELELILRDRSIKDPFADPPRAERGPPPADRDPPAADRGGVVVKDRFVAPRADDDGGAVLDPFAPRPAGSTLRVNASPWAQVRVDGRVVGNTPLVIALSPGRHRVELVRDGARVTRVITMKAGEDQRLTIRLPDTD